MFMKKLFSTFLVSLFFWCAFAIPGATQYIPDVSGDYVYYKDNSFNRESYIGLLHYDESTYKIRYYAPKDNNSKLPEKELGILISINKDSVYWNMNGEYIINQIDPNSQDVDLVNYLHDFLYEFSARRNKIQDVEKMNLSSEQEYPQFGGAVTIMFDAIVPIFNIRDIISQNGEKVLECVCIGRLTSSDDEGFDSFTGFKEKITDNSFGNKIKGKKSNKVSFEGKSITIDENWTQNLENFWTLGDDALLTLVFVPDASKDDNQNKLLLLRRLLSSTYTSYIHLPSAKMNLSKETKISIYTESYDAAENTYIITNKLLNKRKTGGYDYASLAVYENTYAKNQSYFNKILKSYK